MTNTKSPLKSAIAKARRVQRSYAEDTGATRAQMSAALDACDRAYNRDFSDDRETLYGRVSALRAAIPAIEEQARASRQHGRDVAMARLDLQERGERTRGTRYVPGVGYVVGQTVIG